VIRHSCRMRASSLQLTNMESHKSAPSHGRLLMDSRASNPSLVQGLTRPTKDPTQIKSKEARGRVMFHQPSSVRVAQITRWYRVVSMDTGGSIPRHRQNVAITWTKHWCSSPSGRTWRRPGSPSRPHASPFGISLARRGSTEGQRVFELRRTGCEPFEGGLTPIRVRSPDKWF
jgi:hypothetical protein